MRRDALRVRMQRVSGRTPKGLLNQPFYLPAKLGDTAWTEEALHTEYGTIRAGQFSQPALGPATARQLRDLGGWDTLTVDNDPAWMVANGQDPDVVEDTIDSILRSRQPVELLVTLPNRSTKALLDLDVTFRSVAKTMKGGEPDTLYFTLGLKEWREQSTRRRGTEPRGGKLVKVDLLDTLVSLSRFYYGTPMFWEAIRDANGLGNWGSHTGLRLHPKFAFGGKILIPERTIIRG